MNQIRTAKFVLAALSLACGIGLLILTAGDGIVTGTRGPRVGAFVNGNLLTALIFLLAGLIAIGAAMRGDERLALAGGGVLLAAAVIHLLSIAVGADPLGASGSTLAAFLGIGGGLFAIGVTPPLPVAAGDGKHYSPRTKTKK